MNLRELEREQQRLSRKIVLRDGYNQITTLGGILTKVVGEKLLASVIVCRYPSFEVIDSRSFLLHNPLPYRQGFEAYRSLPAMIEAYNQLEIEPDVLFVLGNGVAHTRGIGLASHLGLSLHVPTIGVTTKLAFGDIREGKIFVRDSVCGFEVKSREHANPIYLQAGHLITPGSVLRLSTQVFCSPHKMPEPLHLANKYARKVK